MLCLQGDHCHICVPVTVGLCVGFRSDTSSGPLDTWHCNGSSNFKATSSGYILDCRVFHYPPPHCIVKANFLEPQSEHRSTSNPEALNFAIHFNLKVLHCQKRTTVLPEPSLHCLTVISFFFFQPKSTSLCEIELQHGQLQEIR